MIQPGPRRLRTILVGLLIISTLGTLVTLVAAGSGLLLWRLPQIHRENLARVQREAGQLAEHMELLLVGRQRQLELAAAALARRSPSSSTHILDALTGESGAFDAVYLSDRDGRVLAASLRSQSPARRDELLGSDLSANRLFRLTSERNGVVWSNKFLSALSGDVTVGIASPAGERLLFAEFPLPVLLRALEVATRDSRLETWVVDRRGELIVEAGSERKLGPVNLLGMPLVRKALSGEALPETVTIEGKDFYPAVARSDLIDWFFLVRMPAGLNDPRIRSTALLIVAALLTSLLIGIALAPPFANRIARPVRAIIDRARRIGDDQPPGDWPRGPIAELNELAGDLERMAGHLDKRRRQLSEAQRIAGLGSWEHALGGDALDWSEGLDRILGRDGRLGPPAFSELASFYTRESWERLSAAMAKTLAVGDRYEIEAEMIRADGSRCWTTTRGEAVRGPDGAVIGLRGIVHDITARRQNEELIRANNRILESVARVQREVLLEADPRQRFDRMLALLLDATGSEYGFIGEVHAKPDGQPYLKTQAITNIAWNDETRVFYERNAPAGLEFHNLDTLFGAVITSRGSVVANDPATDPRRGGLPAGHPPLNAFLGVPFFHGDTMIGMVGLSNREGGYDQDLVASLVPILATCSSLVLASSLERERNLGEERLRAALAEKEVLLKEIYHRVKNNLQVVSSLLNLQSRRAPDAQTKQLLDDSASRVKSMALVHEQLYRAENLSSIDLRAYLLKLAQNLTDVNRPLSARVALTAHAAEVSVGVETAIPLGLVVNELVSNAYRHGYPRDAGSGTVEVRLDRLDGGRLRLTVRDDGRGLPADFEPEKGQSLGMELVATLARQLNAELACRDGCPGASFTLEFKPEAVQSLS